MQSLKSIAMFKLTKRANHHGRTDPNHRKASLLKIVHECIEPNVQSCKPYM